MNWRLEVIDGRRISPETGRMIKNETILVIGGNGKTGRRVAERLRARDVPVRLASRSGETTFDWDDQSHLGAGAARARPPPT